MSGNSAFGGRRIRAGAAAIARAAGAVAAAAVALGSTALPAGAAPTAPTAQAVAGGPRPRASLAVEGDLMDVAAISSSNAWAVGGTLVSPETPILAHWDGKIWATVTSAVRTLKPCLVRKRNDTRFPRTLTCRFVNVVTP